MRRCERKARRRDRRHGHRVGIVVVGVRRLSPMRAELRVLVGVDGSAARCRVLVRRAVRLDMPWSLEVRWLNIVDACLGPRPARARPPPRTRRSRDRRAVALRRCRCCRCRQCRLRRPITPPALALGPIAMLDHIRLERDWPRRALELLAALFSAEDSALNALERARVAEQVAIVRPSPERCRLRAS